jgi:sulfatase maturation enzyme AslB (radical SAM superfamily)
MTPAEPIQPADFVESHLARLVDQGAECAACPWVSVCAGYFKRPDPAYGCAGVKELFALIAEAGEEIARDLAGHSATWNKS